MWSSAEADAEGADDSTKSTTEYTQRAFEDAAQWTLFRPYLDSDIRLDMLDLSNAHDGFYSCDNPPCTPPYVPKADELVVRLLGHGGKILSTVQERGGEPRVEDMYLEVYLQDVSKIESGLEASMRTKDTRFFTTAYERVEPDDWQHNGFMKSPLARLNSTFTKVKMAEYLNKTSIALDKHLINKRFPVSELVHGKLIVIKKEDVKATLGNNFWSSNKKYVVCVTVRNRGPLRSSPTCMGDPVDTGVLSQGAHVLPKGCPAINQTAHPSFKPVVLPTTQDDGSSATRRLTAGESTHKWTVTWPNALDGEIGNDYRTVPTFDPETGVETPIVVSDVKYRLEYAVRDGLNHKFDPVTAAWTTLNNDNDPNGAESNFDFPHCPYNADASSLAGGNAIHGPCQKNWSPSSDVVMHSHEHSNLEVGKVYVYRLSIVGGLGGGCDDIKDYSKKDLVTGSFGERVRYSVISAAFQYNGTLAHVSSSQPSTGAPGATVAPGTTVAPAEPVSTPAPLEPVGAINSIELCVAGSGCANDVDFGDRVWRDGPKKRFMLKFPVPASGSSSALLYKLQAEKLTHDSHTHSNDVNVESRASLRFPYTAMNHLTHVADMLTLCVGADRSDCGPADSYVKHPVFADASFLEVDKQFRFRVRAERLLRNGDVEAGAWSPWTTTEDGTGLLIGPPRKDLAGPGVVTDGQRPASGFSHQNAVVLEFENHFKIADDVLGKPLDERRVDAGWAPEGVVDALRYDVYRFDMGSVSGGAGGAPAQMTVDSLPPGFKDGKTVDKGYLLKSVPLKAMLKNEHLFHTDDTHGGHEHVNSVYNGNPFGSSADVHRIIDDDVEDGHQYAYRVAIRNRGRDTVASDVVLMVAHVDSSLPPYTPAPPMQDGTGVPMYGHDVMSRQLLNEEDRAEELLDGMVNSGSIVKRLLQSANQLSYRMDAIAYQYVWSTHGASIGGCRTWSIASVNSFGSSDFNAASSYCSVCVPGSSPGANSCTQVSMCVCTPGVPVGMMRPYFSHQQADSAILSWTLPSSMSGSAGSLTGYNLRVRAVYSNLNASTAASTEVSLSMTNVSNGTNGTATGASNVVSMSLDYYTLRNMGLTALPNANNYDSRAQFKEYQIEARVQAVSAQGVSQFSEWSMTNANAGRALNQPDYPSTDYTLSFGLRPMPQLTVGHDADDATKLRVELDTPFHKWHHAETNDWPGHLTHEVILGHLGDPHSDETHKDPALSSTVTTTNTVVSTVVVAGVNGSNSSSTTVTSTVTQTTGFPADHALADDKSQFDSIFKTADGALRTVCVLRWPNQVCELDASSKVFAPEYDPAASVLGAFSFSNYVLGARPQAAGAPHNMAYAATAASDHKSL